MKRSISILAVVVLALLLTDAAVGGGVKTVRFDDLPLGTVPPAGYDLGKFLLKPFGFGDPVVVVDLGDGRRGLADGDPTNGGGAGVSIVPAYPRSTMRVESVRVRADRTATNSFRVQGQWSNVFQQFSPAPGSRDLIPAIAGKDIAFLNLTLYGADADHGLALESVDVSRSKAVESGNTYWSTTEKNGLKVAGFRKDRWSPLGEYSFPVDGTWLRRESQATGSLPDFSGDCRRASHRTFTLVLDDARRAEIEAVCRERFRVKTGLQANFTITGVTGLARINAKRTKIGVRLDITGTAWGDFGSREFRLRVRSKGIRAR